MDSQLTTGCRVGTLVECSLRPDGRRHIRCSSETYSIGNAGEIRLPDASTPIMSLISTTDRHRRFVRGMIVAGVILGVILLTFLCLRPSPHVRDFAWLPRWFVQSVDTHGVWRNSWAFGALAALAGGAVPSRKRMQVYVLVAAFATVLELVQLMIPSRVFDLRDIGASWLGIGFVIATTRLSHAIRSTVMRLDPEVRTVRQGSAARVE